jgi:hypothetical protein
MTPTRVPSSGFPTAERRSKSRGGARRSIGDVMVRTALAGASSLLVDGNRFPRCLIRLCAT